MKISGCPNAGKYNSFLYCLSEHMRTRGGYKKKLHFLCGGTSSINVPCRNRFKYETLPTVAPLEGCKGCNCTPRFLRNT